MPDTAFPILHKINSTPIRDLVRGRLSGRLDWKAHLAGAGLPTLVAQMILRVVTRTRLSRLEKAAVSSELIAHFSDGLASDIGPTQLLERFGDERVAAQLIRRAKLRGRSGLWHMWIFSARCLMLTMAIYAFFLLRFCLGHPTPSVDYIAKLNELTASSPQNDRAWPLWRQALLAWSDGLDTEGHLSFSKAVVPLTQNAPPWPETARWIDEHAGAINVARAAAKRPVMGFVLGPGGSADDSEIGFSFPHQFRGEPLVNVVLPHLNYLLIAAEVLSSDAKLGAQRTDAVRVGDDLFAMLGLGRQLHDSDRFLVSQLVSLGINRLALKRLRFVLVHYPGLLSDAQLIQLAHLLSLPRVAADVVNLRDERFDFADIVQRLYTDNGHGDGHITLAGLRFAPVPMSAKYGGASPGFNAFAIASTVPLLGVSRAEMVAAYERLMDEMNAQFHLPLRQVDEGAIEPQFTASTTDPLQRIRFRLVFDFLPGWRRAQEHCERYLGERDGAVVGIALELFRRRHGKYPEALNELMPQLLPEIPADRITGDPVKYRLMAGHPVVYSVGADRVDDGGKPPACGEDAGPRLPATAANGENARNPPRGDWLLYAPDPTDEDSFP